MSILPGILVLVAGPSGAGKDSILSGAQQRLRGDTRFAFPRRIITRPAAAGGEAHMAITPQHFAMLEQLGGFLANWSAHGLDYGIPAAVLNDLAEGRIVSVNVSRKIILALQERFPGSRYCLVSARLEILRERLVARGREVAADVGKRIDRASEIELEATPDITIMNDGRLVDAVQSFVLYLRKLTKSLAP